jgi:hypothetical protein
MSAPFQEIAWVRGTPILGGAMAVRPVISLRGAGIAAMSRRKLLGIVGIAQ